MVSNVPEADESVTAEVNHLSISDWKAHCSHFFKLILKDNELDPVDSGAPTLPNFRCLDLTSCKTVSDSLCLAISYLLTAEAAHVPSILFLGSSPLCRDLGPPKDYVTITYGDVSKVCCCAIFLLIITTSSSRTMPWTGFAENCRKSNHHPALTMDWIYSPLLDNCMLQVIPMTYRS